MTKLVIVVTGNKTLGSGDDGSLQRVTAAATITIPKDTTYKFVTNDQIDVIRNTTDAVSVVPATGVILNSAGTSISKPRGFVSLLKTGDNTWLGWGDFA